MKWTNAELKYSEYIMRRLDDWKQWSDAEIAAAVSGCPGIDDKGREILTWIYRQLRNFDNLQQYQKEKMLSLIFLDNEGRLTLHDKKN